MKRLVNGEALPGLLVSATAAIVYFVTLAPSVQAVDSGELASAAATLGIAHPTGYPLFTLLAALFARLPLGDARVILNLNLMAALLCVVAVYVLYRLFLLLLTDRILFRPLSFSGRRDASHRPDPRVPTFVADRCAAALAAFVLAFSKTFWAEAVSVEVYSLHLLLLSLATLLFLRGVNSASESHAWTLFAYVLGLSFANHMMTGLLAPAFLFLFFSLHGFGKSAWIRISRAIAPFLLGLTPYLYLPVRALAAPVVQWGDTSDPVGFWRHVTAAQYQFRMFSGSEVVTRKLGNFAGAMPSEFGYAPLIPAAIGVWVLLRKAPRLFLFCALLFATCLWYALSYDFDDPDFYLNAWIVTAIAVAFGLRAIMAWAVRGRAMLWAACALGALSPLIVHYRVADASRDYAVEDYARNVLGSLDSGAILVTGDERYLAFPAMYLQVVEGYRMDAVILHLGLLWQPWYFNQLERRHPGLLANARPEIRAYVHERLRFEARHYRGPGDPAARGFDTVAYQASYERMLDALLWRSQSAVYATPDAGLQNRADGFPDGLALRLYRRGSSPPPFPAPPGEFVHHPFTRENAVNEDVRANYAAAYANHALFRFFELNDTAAGVALLRKAAAIKPDLPGVADWLRQLGG